MKLGRSTNFDMLFLVMGFISLFDEMQGGGIPLPIPLSGFSTSKDVKCIYTLHRYCLFGCSKVQCIITSFELFLGDF